MGKLKNLLIQLEDPLDERILDVIKEISQVIHDQRNDFLNKYRHLVRLSGDDMPLLRDELIEACKTGPQALIAMLKISIIAYNAALARNTKNTIADIAMASADLAAIVNTAFDQQGYFRTSLEHIALSWNSVAHSMSEYMSEIDKRTLKVSHTLQRLITSHPPQHLYIIIPNALVGTRLTLSPGSSYNTNYAVLNYITTDNIGFVASGSRGMMLAKLIEAVKKPKPLEKLNRDLSADHQGRESKGIPEMLQHRIVHCKTSETKGTCTHVPNLNNQWVRASLLSSALLLCFLPLFLFLYS